MPQMFQDCVPEDLLFLYYLPYQNYLSQGTLSFWQGERFEHYPCETWVEVLDVTCSSHWPNRKSGPEATQIISLH